MKAHPALFEGKGRGGEREPKKVALLFQFTIHIYTHSKRSYTNCEGLALCAFNKLFLFYKLFLMGTSLTFNQTIDHHQHHATDGKNKRWDELRFQNVVE